jgi:hypothetical protein
MPFSAPNPSRTGIIANLHHQLTRAFKQELEDFDLGVEACIILDAEPEHVKGLVRAATISAHNLALELVEHFGRGESVGPEEDPEDPEPVSAVKEAA